MRVLSAAAISAPWLGAVLQVLLLLEAAHSLDPALKVNHTVNDTTKNITNSTPHPSATAMPVTSPSSTASSSNHTVKPTEHQITSKSPTPGTKSTPKPQATTGSIPQNTTHTALKTSPGTASNSSVTTAASLATATANMTAKMNKGSKFDIGSFVGGIVLTLGVLSILYIGCKTYYSRGIRYRTIDEHDAII